MTKLLWLALAGAVGSLCRYGLSGLVQRLSGSLFPWGTLVVNLIGCFAFGALWAMFENRLQVAPEVRLLILAGFLGAFTTFSTFIFETSQLLREGAYLLAIGNLGLQNGLGMVAVFLGITLGRASSI